MGVFRGFCARKSPRPSRDGRGVVNGWSESRVRVFVLSVAELPLIDTPFIDPIRKFRLLIVVS
jgi:hypothetical protein